MQTTSPPVGLSATVRIETGSTTLTYQVEVPGTGVAPDERHVRQVLGAGVLMGIALLDGEYTEEEYDDDRGAAVEG